LPGFGILEAVRQWRFPFVTALLILLAAAGLVLIAGGAVVAIYANSPANRVDNSFAGVGVAVGVVIAALGALIAVICTTALAVRSRRG
jgi:Na+-translocating ferredoxin:NAD+ oxidoreductase RnfD subunit